ncbi:hypothetical protein [Pseudoxanthomonas japonensis]|uniref:hypothetical protein n=1 Tax=Pseudoxanthomonas japonensis TaxID=69284 RepID=UPI003748F985
MTTRTNVDASMKSRPRHSIGALVALQGSLCSAVQAPGTDGRGDTARARRRPKIVMASAKNTALPAGRRWSLRGMAALLAMAAGLHASPALAQLSCSNVYATNADGQIYETPNSGAQMLVGSVTGLPAATNPFGISPDGSRLYLAASAPARSTLRMAGSILRERIRTAMRQTVGICMPSTRRRLPPRLSGLARSPARPATTAT